MSLKFLKVFERKDDRFEISPSFHPRLAMKIHEKSFPSFRRIPLFLLSLLCSVFILLACGGGGGSSSGGSSGSDGGNPVDETFAGAVTLEINGGAARTGQR